MSYKKEITRRNLLGLLSTAAVVALLPQTRVALAESEEAQVSDVGDIDFAKLTEEQWRERLTDEQFRVLRDEGTEYAGSSPLNDEKRKGTFVCAGCGQPLFHSHTKYDSGTGWPSFFDPIPGAINTKKDFKLIWPRTEYHCSNCSGHQGHVFDDGPPPTGKRYCNNGVALNFIADEVK